MVDRSSSLPVRLHSGIDTFCLPWQRCDGDTTTNVGCSKTFFIVKSVYTNSVLNARVQTLVILQAKFYVVLSLLSVLKITILCPCTPLKISLPENKTTVNLKNASFVVIMLLHEDLTHIQSQIKPWLLFGESFTSSLSNTNISLYNRSIHNGSGQPCSCRCATMHLLTA